MAAIAYSEVARVKRVEPGQHRTHAPQQSSSYLITSSARPSSESGTVGPSTLEWTVIAGTNRALPLPKPLTREPRVSTLDKLSRRLGSIRHNRELIRLTALGATWICLALPLSSAPAASAEIEPESVNTAEFSDLPGREVGAIEQNLDANSKWRRDTVGIRTAQPGGPARRRQGCGAGY